MPQPKYLARLIDEQVRLSLQSFGAICLEGPKCCGKSWTAKQHAKRAFCLDEPATKFQNQLLFNLPRI